MERGKVNALRIATWILEMHGLSIQDDRAKDPRDGVADLDPGSGTRSAGGLSSTREETLQRFFTCGTEAASGSGAEPWIEIGDSISGILRSVVLDRKTVHLENPGGDPKRIHLPPLHPEAQSL